MIIKVHKYFGIPPKIVYVYKKYMFFWFYIKFITNEDFWKKVPVNSLTFVY